MRLRVALAQVLSSDDPVANLRLVEDAVAAAAADGAALVVLPEATMCCFGVPLGPVAEPLDGPWATRVRAIAAAAGVVVVAGMFTPDGERVRNTLLVTGPDVETSYDKIHLFDAYGFQESRTVAAGDRPVSFMIDGVQVGLATCYDVRFPALFQQLAADGAQVVVVPASWGAGPGKREQWELLVRARALDSTTYVVACGQADPTTAGRAVGTAPTGIGHSLVAGPMGEVVGSLGAAEGRLVVDLDPEVVADARRVLPVLANRRV